MRKWDKISDTISIFDGSQTKLIRISPERLKFTFNRASSVQSAVLTHLNTVNSMTTLYDYRLLSNCSMSLLAAMTPFHIQALFYVTNLFAHDFRLVNVCYGIYFN